MTRQTKATAPVQKTEAEIEADKAAALAAQAEEQAAAGKAAAKSGIKPLKALHTINGGDDFGGASPNTFFVPQSEKQRTELLDLEAAIELTDAEAALAEKITVRGLGMRPDDGDLGL